MKRIAIILMALVLMVALGFFGADTSGTRASIASHLPAIASTPASDSIFTAASHPDSSLNGRAEAVGAVSLWKMLRPVSMIVLVMFSTLAPVAGYRQVLLVRIRD